MTDVLLVKMSSLGDVVHTLPAITDACRALPEARFDWVVEGAFAPIARLHPGVRSVLPIELRRWRRAPWQSRGAWRAFRQQLRARHYDVVLDAQGLLKSAFVTAQARGERVGLDGRSAREPLASVACSRALRVPWGQHAVTRLRQLFAAALEYPLPASLPACGVTAPALPAQDRALAGRYLLFLHGTTWDNKLWPEAHWRALCAQASALGWPVRLAHAGAQEHARAERIVAGQRDVQLLPVLSLGALLPWIANAAGVVSVDSGLGHLAAAFSVPVVMLYGPTSAALTGGVGIGVHNLEAGFPCAPCLRRTCGYRGAMPVDGQGVALAPACLGSLTPARVWQDLAERLPR